MIKSTLNASAHIFLFFFFYVTVTSFCHHLRGLLLPILDIFCFFPLLCVGLKRVTNQWVDFNPQYLYTPTPYFEKNITTSRTKDFPMKEQKILMSLICFNLFKNISVKNSSILYLFCNAFLCHIK